jgi:hypothetical protein
MPRPENESHIDRGKMRFFEVPMRRNQLTITSPCNIQLFLKLQRVDWLIPSPWEI